MRLHRSLLLLAASAAGGLAAAQSPLSVSESYVMTVRATPASAGTAAGVTYFARASATALAAESALASSAGLELETGLAWTPAQLSFGGPMLIAVAPEGGDSDGGSLTQVHGFNLADPAGPAAVSFGGAPATSTVVHSNTLLELVTPTGENAFGNPLGPVAVAATTSAGTHQLAAAYVYRPALLQESSACFGCTLALELQAEPGAFHMLARGAFLPGFALPIPPLEGALEIAGGIVVLTGLQASPSGTAVYSLPIPLLAVPPFQVDFQAVALDSLDPLGGSFTNRLTVAVGP